MSSKKVRVKEWKCDACGKAILVAEDASSALAGWTKETISITSGAGEYSKGIDLCEICSTRAEIAKRQAKSKWGQ